MHPKRSLRNWANLYAVRSVTKHLQLQLVFLVNPGQNFLAAHDGNGVPAVGDNEVSDIVLGHQIEGGREFRARSASDWLLGHPFVDGLLVEGRSGISETEQHIMVGDDPDQIGVIVTKLLYVA